MTTQEIVGKLWNLCNVLRDDGITYHQYVTELTYILFLKMAKETESEKNIPEGYRWDDLKSHNGLDLKKYYKGLLDYLGEHGTGRIQEIYAGAGGADDGYAVDEIRKMLAGLQPPAGKFVLPEEEAEAGYEILFDGTDLSKWTGDMDGYTPVNGTIFVTAGYGNARNLYTVKEYRDFILRFDFCFVKPGVNNGVGIRTPMGVDAAYWGMCEVQILDHDDPIYKGLNEYQVHGSAYGIIPAKRVIHRPLGEWNSEEIKVVGDRVTVTLNGEVILDGNLREACQGHNVAPDGNDYNPYTVDHRNHPGMFNEKGHVGFLGHGAGIKFRNVRILDLSE